MLETSHPPTYYLPLADFVAGALRPAAGGSFCEWKGQASYLDLVGGDAVAPSGPAWSYPTPTRGLRRDRRPRGALPRARWTAAPSTARWSRPQPGGFYGGWVTSRVVGPFKGGPGTMHW